MLCQAALILSQHMDSSAHHMPHYMVESATLHVVIFDLYTNTCYLSLIWVSDQSIDVLKLLTP